MRPHPEMETKTPSITSCLEDFEPVLQRFGTYVDRLQQLSDKVNGPQPRPAGTAQPPDAPHHSVIALANMKRNRMVEFLDDMEHFLNELERGI